jgi:hypothetical protein
MTIDGQFNARPQRQTEELPMTSLRTTAPMFLKAPKIYALICNLSVLALVLLTRTVGAQQNALEREFEAYLKSEKEIQQKPTLEELVKACVAIVRKETNERLKYQASEFDAYAKADGSVTNIGTLNEDFSFGKCMNEKGHPLGDRVKSRQGGMMGEKRKIRDSMSIEEATVSNIWEIAAIVEVLEWKGLLQEIPRRVIRTESQRPACYTAPE